MSFVGLDKHIIKIDQINYTTYVSKSIIDSSKVIIRIHMINQETLEIECHRIEYAEMREKLLPRTNKF